MQDIIITRWQISKKDYKQLNWKLWRHALSGLQFLYINDHDTEISAIIFDVKMI